jgi:hypothetical protein
MWPHFRLLLLVRICGNKCPSYEEKKMAMSYDSEHSLDIVDKATRFVTRL